MNIRPGSGVDCIVNIDLIKETIDVRRAIIYDIEADRYILSQTTPTLKSYNLGKRIFITYLSHQQNQFIRFGFSGRVLDIVRDYPLSSSQTVHAVIAKKNSGFDSYDLRMHYRLKPGADCPFSLEMDTQSIHLLNISLGGSMFSHDNTRPMEPSQLITVIYRNEEGTKYPIMAKVKRVSPPADAGLSNLEYVAVQFTNKGIELTRSLSLALLQAQRATLYKA
jgi:hypothetical protein